ncbi:MAG: DUF1236 domain-containing protein [Rhodobiaceae bacterium]|nr:DUF1236 domain-containing protein [Rhodobiaceae bacterium]MCC0056319.1 DUF1236 domain-containing protein [Rhodobiaceae bacterium]
MFNRKLKSTVAGIAIAGAALAIPFAAQAATGTVYTDLNVRSGPGPQYQVIGVINPQTPVVVNGCTEGGNWCQVSYGGQQGWAYSRYIALQEGGGQVVLSEQTSQVPVVTYDNPPRAGGAVSGAVGGAVVGAIIGGPVGAAIGGAAGAAAGTAGSVIVNPPQRVVTYVEQQQVQPVYLDGEVVVGARVPQTVQLYQVPEYEYRYAYVNGQAVLINPNDYEIVSVIR